MCPIMEIVLDISAVIGWWANRCHVLSTLAAKWKLWLVDLNYSFEYDWFIELSDNKLSDNNLASELVENRSLLTQPQSRKIVILIITMYMELLRIWLIEPLHSSF